MFMFLYVYWSLWSQFLLAELAFKHTLTVCLYVCPSPNFLNCQMDLNFQGIFLQVSSFASDKNFQCQGRLRQHTLHLVLFSNNTIMANQFDMKNGFRQIAIVQHEKFQTKIQFFILQKDTQIFYHQILNMNGCYSK